MKEVKLKRPCEIHEVKTPWIDHLEGVPAHLNYFQGSMYDKLAEIATNYPDYIAYDFMGGKVKYRDFINKVDECASDCEHGTPAFGREGNRILPQAGIQRCLPDTRPVLRQV